MTLAQIEAQAALWNSLEVSKLIAAVLTPLSVIVFGYWLNGRLKQIEHLQWANQKVIEKRLSVFEEISPLLNDVLCYFTFVGGWKELTPLKVVRLKRQIDRIAYVNAPLFPRGFVEQYNAFIGLCFDSYSGWGADAKLRTLSERRAEAAGPAWRPEWDECFAPPDKCSDVKAIRSAYSSFVAYLASELGVGVTGEPIATGHPPANIR
ncbi:MAG: hypothetical protein QM770_09195 [Tepidisphaeraceae bacterium]